MSASEELANLPSDQYYIRNGQQFAGRNHVEDRSLLPKKVFCPTDSPELDLWELERLPNGRYRICARGAPTKDIHNLLYALLIERERADEWIITKRCQEGSRILYTIEKAIENKFWVKKENPEEPQIEVQDLPPQDFPPRALWNIQPLVE